MKEWAHEPEVTFVASGVAQYEWIGLAWSEGCSKVSSQLKTRVSQPQH